MSQDIRNSPCRYEPRFTIKPTGRGKAKDQVAFQDLVWKWLGSGEPDRWMRGIGEGVNETYNAAQGLHRLYGELVQDKSIVRLLARLAVTELAVDLFRVGDRKVVASVDLLTGGYTYDMSVG